MGFGIKSIIDTAGSVLDRYRQGTVTRHDTRSWTGRGQNEAAVFIDRATSYAGSLSNMIANASAQVPIRLYRKRSGPVSRLHKSVSRAEMGDDWIEVTSHPVLHAISSPGEYTTSSQMNLRRHLDLIQSGMAFDVVAPGEGIRRLAPRWTRPVITESESVIDGFAYSRRGESSVYFKPSEVVWYRYAIAEDNPFGAYSPYQNIMKQLDLMAANIGHDINMAQNGMIPDFVVTLPEGTSPEQAQAFSDKWREKHSGANRSHEPLFIPAGVAEILQLTRNEKDLNSIAKIEMLERHIRQEMGVPETMGDLNSANLASAKVGYSVEFLANTVRPRVQTVAEQMTEFMLPKFPGTDGMVFVADDPVPDAVEQQQQRLVSYVGSGIKTINEARIELGEPAVSGGNDLRINGQSIESLDQGAGLLGGGLFGPQAEVQSRKVEETAINGAQIAQLVDLASKVSEGLLSVDSARSIAIAALPGIPSDKISEIFDNLKVISIAPEPPSDDTSSDSTPDGGSASDQREESGPKRKGKGVREALASDLSFGDGCCTKDIGLGVLNASQVDLDRIADRVEKFLAEFARQYTDEAGVVNMQAFSAELADLLDDELEDAFMAGVDEIVGGELIDDLPAQLRPKITEYAIEQSVQIMGTTQAQLADALNRGLDEGLSIGEIAKEIEDAGYSRTRAEVIARTETANAVSVGKLETAKVRGFTAKRWRLAPGNCPICGVIAAQTNNGGKGIPIRDAFWSGGKSVGSTGYTPRGPVVAPPAHPNCRCDMDFIMGDEE